MDTRFLFLLLFIFISNLVSSSSTEYGMYKPNCGLENLLMSWGHDEYLYRVLVHNKAKFPQEGLWMIRYAIDVEVTPRLNVE